MGRKPGPRQKSLAERFWPKVDRRGSDECWLWMGSKSRNGYGRIKDEGDRKAPQIGAHQAAYRLTYGSIPLGFVIHHECGQRACVNPKHLRAVPQSENVRRRFEKGPSPEPILYARSGRPTDEERFWAKVDKRGPDECWPWKGAKKPSGHGVFRYNGRNVGAYRVSYELLVGATPDGYQIDHLCRNPSCVNPAHLQPVTHHENLERAGVYGVHRRFCKWGHEYTPENTYVDPKGMRFCRACRRRRYEETIARRVAAGRIATQRSDRCGNGHEWTVENTYIDKQGNRHCRACKREWARDAWRRRKGLSEL
jgi:hypothetical protein